MYRSKIFLTILILLSVLILNADDIYMDSPFNTGSNALFYNPAFLGRQDVPKNAVDFYRLDLGFTNNLISPDFTNYLFPNSGTSDYDLFINDQDPIENINDTITDEKKQAILRSIGDFFYLSPTTSLALSPVLPLNIKIGNFAIGQKNYVGELTHLPADMFQLLLYGNEFDNTYDFSDLHLDAQAYMAFSTGLGAEIPLDNGMSVNFGISGSYLAGFGYFEVDADSTVLESETSHLRQTSYLTVKYGLPMPFYLDSMYYDNNYSENYEPDINGENLFPPPGNGFDLNIGLALNLTDELLLETSYNHAISRVYWGNAGKEYTVVMKTDSINAAYIYGQYDALSSDSSISEDDLQEILMDSMLYDTIILEEEELVSILEPQFNLGILYHMKYLPLSTFVRYTQGFKNTAFSSVYPKFTAGVQYTMWRWLLLESAFAFGGREKFQFNVGLGLNFDKYTTDIQFTQDRGVFQYNKGLHLSLNAGLHSTTYGRFSGTVIDSVTKEPLIAKLTVRRNNAPGIDTLITDSTGYFSRSYRNTRLSVMVTAENYDTIVDSMDILKRDDIERLYKLNPAGGRLLVKVIDGVSKNIMPNAMVIFTDDTLYTDSMGTVEKRLEEGENVIVVKAENKEDNVFTIEVEKGKNYSKLVKMMPLYGKFRIFTYNASTGDPVESAVKIYTTDMKTTVDSVNTGSDGKVDSKPIRKGNYNLHIIPIEDNYIEQDKYNVEVKGGYIKQVDVALLKEKMVFVFNNILFDFNKATLRPESHIVIDSLATIMQESPSIRVEISGHTDTRGSSSYNRKLSQARAESVRNYLISQHSIDPARIIARGYGEDRPIVYPEETEADYQKNRRVEFTVLGNQ